VIALSKRQTTDNKEIKNKIVELFFKEYERIESIEDNYEARQEWTKNFLDFNQLFDSASSDISSIIQLTIQMKDNVSKKQFTLMNVFLYLLIAEGFMCNVINFISYFLVLNEHDLFSVTKRKYVKKDIQEITKVETSTKIQFLKNHGFEELTKKYDSSLRNKIAHHNYFIDSDGDLWIQGKKFCLIPRLKNFLEQIKFFNAVVEDIGERLAKKD